MGARGGPCSQVTGTRTGGCGRGGWRIPAPLPDGINQLVWAPSSPPPSTQGGHFQNKGPGTLEIKLESQRPGVPGGHGNCKPLGRGALRTAANQLPQVPGEHWPQQGHDPATHGPRRPRSKQSPARSQERAEQKGQPEAVGTVKAVGQEEAGSHPSSVAVQPQASHLTSLSWLRTWG